MKNLLLPALILAATLGAGAQNKQMKAFIDEQLSFAVQQYKVLHQRTPQGLFPRTYDVAKDSLYCSKSDWWCSGFYPGTLLYLYEYAKDAALKQDALESMRYQAKEQFNKGTHDLGFMLYCSFGNAWRLFHDDSCKAVLLNGARSLSTRFNPVVGCIRSWDAKRWKFPVIIDNMMNLEFLAWATNISGDSSFYNIAVTHATTTMHNHFRKDYSSYHVVDYDPATGQVIRKQTAQGYADESAWSRGQAWGLYGYTMMYRETKQPAFLEQAKHIAHFILSNPNLPADKIPYWDYNAPDIPHAYRDASAAAVMASAFLELARYTKGTEHNTYLSTAVSILKKLGSPAYRAALGTNGGFLLQHSVGSLPGKSEVDVPLSYADYYFVEALLRYRQWYL